MLRVALVQSNISWDNVSRNQIALVDQIAKASDLGAKLVVLPEMFNTGFSFPQGELAIEANAMGLEFMLRGAERYGLTLVGSLPDPQGDSEHPYNTMYVMNPTGVLASYPKIHLFGYGGEAEKYRAGSSVVTVVVGGLRISLFVCYDLRFADVFYRLAPQTDVYLVSANWPSSRQLHWETLLRARAIENLAYVVGVNRVGRGGQLEYSGGSQIISPLGDTIVHAQSVESVVCGDICADVVREARRNFPFLQDRRIL